MNIHEYQAKAILAEYGIKLPVGFLANNIDEAVAAAKKITTKVIVVKAQVHAGGRGKAGGIALAKSVDDVKIAATKILGMRLVTPQTGAAGKIVHKLYIEEGSNIKKELYLSIVLDRNTSSIAIVASLEGGMEIEEIAHKHPEKIIKIYVDPTIGLQQFHLRNLAFGLNLEMEKHKAFGKFVTSLYKAFIEKDASQVEINPLVITAEDEFIPLDAKFNFDDNALFRHPDIEGMRDELEDDPLEVLAAKNGLSYVKMDGNIGCMVNGAGLAMATMDIIKLHGGEPANFLDVGGSATTEKVTEAFKIITSDKNVKAILVSIFGGIMKCDIIANGIIEAVKQIGLKIPVVVRLEGTNVELGKKILKEANLALHSVDDMEEATKLVVSLIK